MKYVKILIGLLFVSQTFSIGLQHGVFVSQSTQGEFWRGSSEIIREEFNITIYPDYLDVELEWEFNVGGNKPAEHTNALEIVGNLNLENNSVVIGMLLWNGDEILKAKLKTKEQAREEYEDVVDRDTEIPPIPRDPVIFEWIRDDNYDISIFPVTWGKTRKLRFRYLVPGHSVNGKTRFGYPHAFTTHATVNIKKGQAVSDYNMDFSDGTSESREDDSWAMENTQYSFNAYRNTFGKKTPMFVRPTLEKVPEGSILYLGNFSRPELQGQMVKLIAKAPMKTVQELATKYENNFSLEVTLTNGRDSITKPVPHNNGQTDTYYEIRAYSEKSIIPGSLWFGSSSIIWNVKVNGEVVKRYLEKPEIVRFQDGIQYARVIGAHSFYPMVDQMPLSMASTLGFVDEKYALLALEEDLLGEPLSTQYRESGVPSLNPEDIFPDEEDMGFIPSEEWLMENQVKVTMTELQTKGISYHVSNGTLIINLEEWLFDLKEPVSIKLYDIRGNIVAEWTINWLNNPRKITWNPKNEGFVTGMYLLRINIADVTVTKSILVK